MSYRPAVVYTCDGTLAGILCCIFESYTRREDPEDIFTQGETTLFPMRQIPTVEKNALRVWRSLQKQGGETAEWVRDCWLSCVPRCAWLIYAFVRLSYAHGAAVCNMLGVETVHQVRKAVEAVRHEAHLFCGFVRFTQYQGLLASVISPKGLVLPLLREHFTDRFPEETFLIYDDCHQMALLYKPYQWVIEEVEDLRLPAADEEELAFQNLWKAYYEATFIKQRENPRCQMGHMPKRFWKHLVEQPSFSQLPEKKHTVLPAPVPKKLGAPALKP